MEAKSNLDEDAQITTLIVDDHRLTCEMTRAYLNNEGGFAAQHADSVDKAIEAIRTDGPFNVVLLDLEMPGMNGMQGVERFISMNAPGAVILFSGYARTEVALRAIEVGAKGFIPKTLPLSSLVNAIRFAAAGETYLPHSIAINISKPDRRRKVSTISSIEKEVLQGICRGQTNKDIARELNSTEVAIKMHVRSICSKLNVSNRTQIAMTAIAQGLV